MLVRLVSTMNVADDKLRDADAEIHRRSGRKTDITVASIISQSELQDLQRLAAAAPTAPEPAPVEKSLSQIQAQLMTRVTPLLTATYLPRVPSRVLISPLRRIG